MFTRSNNNKYQNSKYVALFVSFANFIISLYLWYIFDASTSNPFVFIFGGSEKLRLDSSGHITPGAAGTQDLGSTSKEFRNLYIGNSGRVYLGDAQEVSLYHDGNNTYLTGGSGAETISGGTGNDSIDGGAGADASLSGGAMAVSVISTLFGCAISANVRNADPL